MEEGEERERKRERERNRISEKEKQNNINKRKSGESTEWKRYTNEGKRESGILLIKDRFLLRKRGQNLVIHVPVWLALTQS